MIITVVLILLDENNEWVGLTLVKLIPLYEWVSNKR